SDVGVGYAVEGNGDISMEEISENESGKTEKDFVPEAGSDVKEGDSALEEGAPEGEDKLTPEEEKETEGEEETDPEEEGEVEGGDDSVPEEEEKIEGEDDSASEEEGETEGEGDPIPEEEKESEGKNDPAPEEEGEAEEEDDPGLEEGGDGSGTGDAKDSSLEQEEKDAIPEQKDSESEVEFPEFEYTEDLDGVTIMLTAEEGVLPEGTIVKIEPLSFEEIGETAGDPGQSFCYDITLYDENEEKLDNSWKQNGTVLVSFSGQRIEKAKEAAVRAEISYIDSSGKEKLIETILLSGEETAAAADRREEDEKDSFESADETDASVDEEPFFEEPEICFEATHFSVYRLTFVEPRTTETGNLDEYLVDDTVSPTDTKLNLFRYETEEENPGTGDGTSDSGYPLQDLLDPSTKLDDDSLQKLFNPDTDLKGKTSHEDVKGLFRKDAKRYYYYVSEENYAVYDTEEQTFRLYDGAAIIDSTAQFLPFTAAEDIFEKSEDVLEESRPKLQVKPDFELSEIKYNSGLSLKVDFYQPDGGEVDTGNTKEAMVFRFSGDDVWVYVDGVLLVDSEGEWTINFMNGEISNKGGVKSTLPEKFEEANVSADFSGHGTFQNGTFHTLEFFYLRRGEQAFPLLLSHNLLPATPDTEVQSAPPDTVVVLDQDNHPMAGAEFALYSANESYETTGEPLAVFTTDESGT
ncbi:MAG: hypothetical protein Q4C63_07110, partial [Eubacteriales bacterium]|nr:hypothetical protein [Eubacteriales bacterium]